VSHSVALLFTLKKVSSRQKRTYGNSNIHSTMQKYNLLKKNSSKKKLKNP
jgi:hypothetical protein